MKTGHAAISMVLALASMLRAQAPAARPAFEVATIKRNASIGANGGGGFAPGPGGRFRITNVDARTLVRIAYRSGPMLFSSQIIGAPAWMDSESYDIAAKVGAELEGKTQAEFIRIQPLLLQSLLEERFKLKVHRETRELQRYALVLASKDGALGPQLRRSSLDCSVDFTKCSPRAGSGTFSSGSTPIASLTNYLASAVVQRVVVDRTGLDGRYEINLEWTPDRTPLPLNGDAPAPPASDRPSIFTALQDQLGLKLEPERGPVDVVVIDHVERPTED
jgi:uncharacterized protein (TIGR03435 family)